MWCILYVVILILSIVVLVVIEESGSVNVRIM